MSQKPPAAEACEKTLAIVKEQFRIAESFSHGNQASWYKEVQHLLNEAIAEWESYEPHTYDE
jgi:hypothetical protein